MHCRICGNGTGNVVHEAPEQMYCLPEKFPYLECGACRSLHIIEIPELSKYYPTSYYSYAPKAQKRSLKDALKRIRARHAFRPSLAGAALVAVFGRAHLEPWMTLVDAGPDAPILDVGCGAGTNLLVLQHFGFSNIAGVDPYAPDDAIDCVMRCEVTDIPKRQYRLIMLHHSLEHLVDPLAALDACKGLLADDGRVLVRIPLAGKYAWQKYGVNWVQLDAPRHLFVYSESAFCRTAERAGFAVERVLFDSTAYQILGSEQVAKKVPISQGLIHPPAEYMRVQAFADELNAANDGDQACFILTKSASARRRKDAA